MANALRELLAEFIIQVDPGGELVKGNARVDALKAAVAQLEARLQGVGKAAAPAAKAVSDVFARAGANANQFLQAQQAKAFTGRETNSGFGALGALLPSGPQLGPTREHFDANHRAVEAYANSLRGRLASAFQVAAASADTFRGSGARVLDGLLSMRTAVIGLATGAAARFTLGLVENIGGIGEAAAKLGVTTDEMQRLDVLAKQNATSVEAIGTAFRTVAKNAVDPSQDAGAAFSGLGINTRQQDGTFKSRQDLFFETAGALADVTDETKRAALAQTLFGRSGLELLPLLSQGRAGLEAQREALAKMATVSPAAIKAADEFGDRWEMVKTELLARVAPLLERVVIPALEKMTDFVVKAAEGLEKFIKQTGLGPAALIGLAVAASGTITQLGLLVSLGGGWIRTLAGMTLAAGRAVVAFARLALPFIFLEDVFTFFQGGDSLTGRLMNWIFGEDAGAGIQKAAVDVLAALKELWGFVKGEGIGPAVSKLATDLNDAAGFFQADVAETLGFSGKAAEIRANVGRPEGAAAAGTPGVDARTQSVTVNVGSTAEVAGAVAGAQRGLERDAAANLAAVGG